MLSKKLAMKAKNKLRMRILKAAQDATPNEESEQQKNIEQEQSISSLDVFLG